MIEEEKFPKIKVKSDNIDPKGIIDYEIAKKHFEYNKFEKIKSENFKSVIEESKNKINLFFEKYSIIEDRDGINLDFDFYTSEEDIIGYYHPVFNAVVFNKNIIENKTDEELTHIVVHEILHALSSKVSLLYKSNDNVRLLNSVGFSRNYTGNNINSAISYFDAFNEGINEQLAIHISYDNPENIIKYSGYIEEMNMVASILDRVFPGREVEFMKNYFKGNLLYLKDIEKYYGKGSVRKLASIKTVRDMVQIYGNGTEEFKIALKNRERDISFFEDYINYD